MLNLYSGGGWYLLGVQSFAAVCYIAWSATVTFILLWVTVELKLKVEITEFKPNHHRL
jgi:ammonia channel protein AmtB